MGKKIIILTALVLGLVSPAVAADLDPSLVGWWKFDGDVLDASGNGRHGTLVGDAYFFAGLYGEALAFDGSGDYVNIDGYKGINAVDGVQQAFTVANWFRTTVASGDREMVTWGTNTGRQRLSWRVYQGKLRTEHGSGNIIGTTLCNDGEWHHGALVVNEGAALRVPQTLLYLDGRQDGITGGSDNTFLLTEGVDVRIGMGGPNNGRYWLGDIDEVRIYDRPLTAGEIAVLAKRPKSYAPNPAPDGLVEATSVALQWQPGGFAAQHAVYVGASPDLAAADLVATQTASTLVVADLVQEQTYYWRIDDIEADGTVHIGDVWSFWVPPMRAYNPQPSDALVNVLTDTKLSWTGGWGPLMHTVYFGTDKAQVTAAVGGMPQMETTYDPGPLALDTTYYWRVDEFYAGQWVASPVWSFKTVPPVPPADDAGLVAWYTLDEGAGRTAIDWSGRNGHGTLTGDVQWAAGILGGALSFDGSGGDYVEAPEAPGVTGTQARTVTAWIKTTTYGEIVSWGQNVAGQKWIFRVQESNGTLGAIRIEVNGGYQVGSTDVRDDEWHHVAAVLADDGSPDALEIALYVDGFLEISSAEQDEPINTAAGVVRIGESPWHNRPFNGLIDDVRIYDRAFTEEQIRQTFGDPLIAWQPQPPVGAVGDVLTITSLSWTPGDGAVQHDVYLTTDPNALAAADAFDATGVYRGRQAEAVYVPPKGFELGKTYFWRVDEVGADGTIHVGRTWSFTITDNIVVNGPQATLDYDNTVDPFVSQITWDVAQDWTHEEFVDLSLEFNGNPPKFAQSADGVITLSGAGTDIWGTRDEFRGAFKQLVGDGTMVARVLSNGTGSNRWAKGGVMIRQSLEGGSVHGFMPITGGDGNGYSFQRRLAADGASTSDNGVAPAVAPPYWVKIERVGSVFSGYVSPDGQVWTPVGTPQTIPMTDPVYIGLAVTSHAAGQVRAYEFDNVASTGNVTGDWQVVDVGGDQGGNDPAPLYVAVQDVAGASSLVLHSNLAATNVTDWTKWRIPLADFAAAGVNLSAVAKVTVGVGDGLPGGKGTLLIRNVQVVPVEPPVVTVAPAGSLEATGNDGMILSINGIPVADLVLGVTVTDFEKWPDHPAPHADDFDLKTYASLDDSSYIITTFAVPVRTVFVIERGANDLGFIQPLDAAGNPVGGLQSFAKSDWFKPGVKIGGQDAGVIVIVSQVPISGLMFLPPAGALMGLDPASISAVPAQ